MNVKEKQNLSFRGVWIFLIRPQAWSTTSHVPQIGEFIPLVTTASKFVIYTENDSETEPDNGIERNTDYEPEPVNEIIFEFEELELEPEGKMVEECKREELLEVMSETWSESDQAENQNRNLEIGLKLRPKITAKPTIQLTYDKYEYVTKPETATHQRRHF